KEINQLIAHSRRELQVRLANAQRPVRTSALRALTAFWLSDATILIVCGIVLIFLTLRTSDRSPSSESAGPMSPVSPAPTQAIEIAGVTGAPTATIPDFQPFW